MSKTKMIKIVRVERTPFLVLGLLIFTVYACLVLYNWNSWKSQYYEDEVYRYRPLVYNRNVKIQEDKRKIFPRRKDVFATLPSVNLNSIRLRSSITTTNNKCEYFNAYIYPLTIDASPLANRLHAQLMSSRYSTSNPKNTCVFVAVLDSSGDLDSLEHLRGREDRHLIYLLNGTFVGSSNKTIQHYFSSDIFGSSGVFLDIEDYTRQKWQPQRPIYGAPRLLNLQIHAENFGPSNLVVAGCRSNRNNSNCIYTTTLEDITRHPANFIFIGYTNARQFHTAFYAALFSGAIPVVTGFDLNTLGLSDLIEWDKAVLRTPPSQLHNLLDYLDQLDDSQVLEMRRKGQFYFLNYLANSKGKN